MTNRHRAGILLFLLALTHTFFSSRARADDVLEVRKAEAVEAAEVAKTGEQDKAGQKPEPERFDLPRELADKLVRVKDAKFEPQRLNADRKADYFLIYFGAHWCPNCKKVTPRLTEFYREQRSVHRNFEVVFVSSDKDEQAMLEFMGGYKMPWPAVKFSEKKNIECITKLAGRGYPCLALVDAGGKLLAHSYGENRKGLYTDPSKTLEEFKEILDTKEPQPASKRVARSDN